MVRALRAQHQGRPLHAARQGRAGRPERRPGRGHGARSPTTSAAGSSTAPPASASRSTGSRWTRSPRSSPAWRVGLTTSGACGDITRNVVGCTLAGIAHDQVVDGHAIAEATHEYFLDNKLYSNLPRKYKISITGCREDCARGLINDVALSGAVHEDGARGFNLRIGGGLSSARTSRASTSSSRRRRRPEVVAGITAIFRDSEENRAKRGRARLKFLVDAMGPEAFREELVRRVGPRAPRAARAPPTFGATTTSASRRRPTASTARSASASRSGA